MPNPSRRVVTGHDADGRSLVLENGPPPREVKVAGEDGAVFHEVWHTLATPAPIDRASGEPEEDRLRLLPPENGTRIRLLDFPPDDARAQVTPEQARAAFAAMGAESASTHDGADSPHPFMHRTETVDYGIVLEGEITLILDTEEVPLKAGDVVIQRGTNHAWANRSETACRMAFILIDGRFDDGL